MTTEQAIEYLHTLPRLGSGPNLHRTQNLLARLGHPERKLRCIHVAGTNGKGTVCTLTASVLQKAGYRVGLTISPYVLEFRERFQINGEMIQPETLAALTEEVQAAIDAMKAAGEECPVEFEAVTALAALWFSRENCDIVVLETGLGGRYDATTAVAPEPFLAAITCIGFDHTGLLGNTLTAIAGEKCGILGQGGTVITYPAQPEEALRAIEQAAEEKHCRLICPSLEHLEEKSGAPFENRMVYDGVELSLPFPGRHQVYNAMMVMEIIRALTEKGFMVSPQALRDGMEQARFPARIERISAKPLILLDGGHNPDGVHALADTLRSAGCPPMTAVLGVLADKSVDTMLDVLGPCLDTVYTVTPECPRAMTAAELAQKGASHFRQVFACDTLEQAVQAAASHGDFIVCGSLYLASEARPLLLRLAGRDA